MGTLDLARFEDADGGLFGPAEIERFMRAEHERARRYRFPIVCCVVAVDRLDQLQDLYGVEARAEIMKTAVRAMRGAMRDSDLLARLSGDQVLIFYAHTGPHTGALLAERVRTAVKKQRFDLDGRTIKVAASVGVVSVEGGSSESFDALVALAHDGLRMAQKAGGDRHVEIGSGTTQESLEGTPAPLSAGGVDADQVDKLERRLARLMSLLDDTEAALRRAHAPVAPVAATSEAREMSEQKRELMRNIFEANRELRQHRDGEDESELTT